MRFIAFEEKNRDFFVTILIVKILQVIKSVLLKSSVMSLN